MADRVNMNEAAKLTEEVCRRMDDRRLSQGILLAAATAVRNELRYVGGSLCNKMADVLTDVMGAQTAAKLAEAAVPLLGPHYSWSTFLEKASR